MKPRVDFFRALWVPLVVSSDCTRFMCMVFQTNCTRVAFWTDTRHDDKRQHEMTFSFMNTSWESRLHVFVIDFSSAARPIRTPVLTVVLYDKMEVWKQARDQKVPLHKSLFLLLVFYCSSLPTDLLIWWNRNRKCHPHNEPYDLQAWFKETWMGCKTSITAESDPKILCSAHANTKFFQKASRNLWPASLKLSVQGQGTTRLLDKTQRMSYLVETTATRRCLRALFELGRSRGGILLLEGGTTQTWLGEGLWFELHCLYDLICHWPLQEQLWFVGGRIVMQEKPGGAT